MFCLQQELAEKEQASVKKHLLYSIIKKFSQSLGHGIFSKQYKDLVSTKRRLSNTLIMNYIYNTFIDEKRFNSRHYTLVIKI